MIRRYINILFFKIKNKSAKLGRGVSLSRKTSVGTNCVLGSFSRLSKDVSLGNNVTIGEYTMLRKIKIGDNTMFESGIKVVGTGKGHINIGKECYMGVNNIIDTSDNITIGDFVHIAGPSTAFWCHSTANMCINGIPLNDINRDKYRPTGQIIVENNVYIGGNCTIYPGITIGNNSIIAPNSAVTKSVPSNTLVGGVPAKEIKKLNTL